MLGQSQSSRVTIKTIVLRFITSLILQDVPTGRKRLVFSTSFLFSFNVYLYMCQTYTYTLSKVFFRYRVMSRCWKNCPEDRPTFKELNSILHEILHTKAVRKLIITIAITITMTMTWQRRRRWLWRWRDDDVVDEDKDEDVEEDEDGEDHDRDHDNSKPYYWVPVCKG